MNLDNMILQAFQSEGFRKSTHMSSSKSKHSWCLLTGLLLLSIQVVDLALKVCEDTLEAKLLENLNTWWGRPF